MENRPLVKFIRNYIRDSSGVFSISSLVRTSMTSFPAFTLSFVQEHSCLYNKKKITQQLEDNLWILFSSGKKQYLPLENRIHIFTPPCNILYIFTLWGSSSFLISSAVHILIRWLFHIFTLNIALILWWDRDCIQYPFCNLVMELYLPVKVCKTFLVISSIDSVFLPTVQWP